MIKENYNELQRGNYMKLTVFDREKYNIALNKLERRKAPGYVIEAYKEGHTNVVNEYYKLKLSRKIGRGSVELKAENAQTLESLVKFFDISMLNEAFTVKDLEFIKAFFKMANLDLVSGDRLPPNAAHLIRQGIAKDFGLNQLFKKLG